MIINLYEEDFHKISPSGVLALLFDAIPAQLARKSSRYHVSSVLANRQAADILEEIAELRERFNQREDVSMVAPGQFRESTSSNRVFFVESMSPDKSTVSNVFVVQHNGPRMVVVASRGGHVKIEENGDRFLVLEDGRRYDGTWGTPEYSLMEFLRYGVRLDPKPVNTQIESVRGMATPDLLQLSSPAARPPPPVVRSPPPPEPTPRRSARGSPSRTVRDGWSGTWCPPVRWRCGPPTA